MAIIPRSLEYEYNIGVLSIIRAYNISCRGFESFEINIDQTPEYDEIEMLDSFGALNAAFIHKIYHFWERYSPHINEDGNKDGDYKKFFMSYKKHNYIQDDRFELIYLLNNALKHDSFKIEILRHNQFSDIGGLTVNQLWSQTTILKDRENKSLINISFSFKTMQLIFEIFQNSGRAKKHSAD